jgi:carboxypeptidase C (cathepsin A)
MKPRIPLSLLVFALTVALPAMAWAQARPGRPGGPPREQSQQEPKSPPREAGQSVLRLLPPDSVTEHSLDLAGGAKLAYTATAGTLALYEQSGEQTAAVFYTAYVGKPTGDTPRALTFAFNGGPGAASAYLHLGLVGPKILDFDARYDAATAQLRDNPQSWLEFTDLVLIDPVGTGWSRAAKPDGAAAFWGVRKDADFFAKVIALYVAKTGRSGSAKYLLGESYGGFRAAKVARALQQDQGITVSGIVMVSPMLEAALQFGGDRFALGAALQLPSLAAAELERTQTFSPDKIAEAERFAMTEYLTTLAGSPPQGEPARAFYSRVATMTGIPEDVVARARGFLREVQLKGLRSADGKVVSRYDGGLVVDDPFPGMPGEGGPDPVLDVITRGYGGAFVGYAHDDLGFKCELTYILLARDISGRWEWRDDGRRDPSASDDLRILLAFNPSLRVLITHGFSDLVTPYMTSRYVVDHLPTGSDRVQLRLYSGGHMFYIADESRKAVSSDAKAFYRNSP